MSVVKTRFKNKENKYKIYSECTKMPIIENEPSLTDIMNELKSFEKKTDARFNDIDKEIKEIKNVAKQTNARLTLLENKVDNVIKLNNLKV